MIHNLQQKAHFYRYEFLLFALMMLLFNKVLFTNQKLYVELIWPSNILLLGMASFGVFKERGIIIQSLKNVLFVCTILTPFFAYWVFSTKLLSAIVLSIYIMYYGLIFVEVLQQITHKDEITLSVILGSICGYLLLILIAAFAFLILEVFIPGSFNNTTTGNIPALYNEITYFSIVTVATIGYGDIAPENDSSRLLAAFFGIAGQFYMVTLVGIIISKFTSK
jgi:voltage-gated potassium channel